MGEDILDIFAYNSSRHNSSKFTPFEVMFGRKPTHPVDVVMDSGTLHDALRAFQEVDVAIAHDELIIHRRECLEIVKQNILDAQQRQKEIYDRKHVCPPTFHLGAQ